MGIIDIIGFATTVIYNIICSIAGIITIYNHFRNNHLR